MDSQMVAVRREITILHHALLSEAQNAALGTRR